MHAVRQANKIFCYGHLAVRRDLYSCRIHLAVLMLCICLCHACIFAGTCFYKAYIQLRKNL